METWGNTDILKLSKTGFLSSQKCPASIVLKSYDWAKKQREQGNCIVCGNHSQIEKDVFEMLLKGNQPLILVLARGIKSRWESAVEEAAKTDRLLVISPFEKEIRRVTREYARIRNQKIIEISDDLVVGYASEGGLLEGLLEGKNYTLLNDVPK
ncbi:MAG: hypothetical protein OXH57_02065 [Ekhidna sp.]|nr:hypothetical protein [Ekhidna sp.]